MKILIVDDNKQNLLLLEATLKGGGHEAVSAGNGIEALEILGKEKVDMIISDVLMPGMDGFKLCMKCKEDEKWKTIPFAFTTSSYTEAKDEEFGISLGADAFIVRPVEPEELLKKIDEILKKKRERKEGVAGQLGEKEVGFLEKYSERLASQLEHKILDLEKEVSERKRAERALQERVKELKCIADISKIAEQPGITIEAFVEKTTALLPSAWRYSENACARITLDGEAFKTENFKETSWSQSAELHINGQKIGRVTVGYLNEKPAADEGPFLKEERDLLNVVADFLSHIIQHRRTEKEIKESEAKFRAIFDNATDGILLADLESKKFFTGNKSICAMLGYGLEELKGLGVMEIHPKEQLPYVVDQFEKQSRKEITLARDIPVKRKDGSVFYADVNSSPVTLEDKQYLLGIFRDITERKRAEEELRISKKMMENIAQGIRDAIMLIDKDFKILWANNTVLKQTGYKPEEILGKHCYEVTHHRDSPCQPPLDPCPIYEFQKTGKPVNLEHIHFDKDKNKLFVEVCAYPIKDERGEIFQFVHLCRNITERKQSEAELKKRLEELEIFYKSAMDREDRIIELKNEVKELKKRLGEA